MLYFLCRLNAPRPSFALDTGEDERALMTIHAEYGATPYASA